MTCQGFNHSAAAKSQLRHLQVLRAELQRQQLHDSVPRADTLAFLQAITVTVKGVTDPKDTDAVALLVPYDANRSVTPPQKFQWLIKGSAGKGYLKTGASTLTCDLCALHSADVHTAALNSVLSCCMSLVCETPLPDSRAHTQCRQEQLPAGPLGPNRCLSVICRFKVLARESFMFILARDPGTFPDAPGPRELRLAQLHPPRQLGGH